MLFTEFRFLGFFLVVLVVHWSLRSNRGRKLWLLASSYLFYAGWDYRFLTLILLSTSIDYWIGRRLGRSTVSWRRKLLLAISCCANLLLLGVFKYFGFFVDSAIELLEFFGLHAEPVVLHVVLPVGISFYTFQTMSYTIDVYRRQLAPVDDIFDLALFVAFFPQLVAGPIVRAVDFLPQLARSRSWKSDVAVRGSLMLFLAGFVKKAVLADHLAVVTDQVFGAPGSYSTGATWIALSSYHVQVYCDFSGYTDMAIATAGLLGYRLEENFAFPYFARSVGGFWRRWHISLSSWIRDYLYIPLGGGQGSWWRRFFNLFVTMSLVGLWHGAAWHYVVFGALHGLFLFVEQRWRATRLREGLMGQVSAALGLPLTNLLLLLGWSIFRTEGLGDASTMLRTALFQGKGDVMVDESWLVLVLVATVVHWVIYRRLFGRSLERVPSPVFGLAYGAAWALVLPLVATGYRPFIYFQF